MPATSRIRPRPAPLGGLLAAAAGAAAIVAVFGWHIVPPHSLDWILSGMIGPDPVQYWLGWTFFRGAPWGLPPGLNWPYGMELSSSIFYADSIPLLAFLLKPLNGILEIPQYWGLWLVGCGALQAWLGWRLTGLATEDPLARLAGALLFALQPLMLNRLGGHFALGAHWLILWGLWLCLTPAGRGRPAGWAALVLAASLIHSYLLPMVLGLWAADWWGRRLMPRPRRWGDALAEAALVPAAGLLGLWAAGFFVLEGGFAGTRERFGEMQMDLLAPLDPSHWGRFLPDLPDTGHLEVNGSYVGLGALLLSGFAVFARPARRHLPLLVVLGLMLAFAVTHRPSLAGVQVTLVPLPERIVELASALRASERFYWPLAYALMVAGAVGLVRVAGPRAAGIVMAGLVVVQVADLGPGFRRLAHYFPAEPPQNAPQLRDPFWAEAATRYRVIRAVPAMNQGPHWEEVAVFAARHGLSTDAVYLARSDEAAKARLRAEVAARLAEGRPEPATLYVLRDAESLARAQAGLRPGRDALRRLDGVHVLVPDWYVTR
ncbi:MAG: DUF6311 domain-containing protein [Rubritepida sp.]|nr:DUF6311 domain-containing protein [Rubritepida sp.]